MSLTADLLFGATLLPHFVYHRLVTGKYGACAPEKLGYGPARQGAAPCVWLHAVSVGETLAARPLGAREPALGEALDQAAVIRRSSDASVPVVHLGKYYYLPLRVYYLPERRHLLVASEADGMDYRGMPPYPGVIDDKDLPGLGPCVVVDQGRTLSLERVTFATGAQLAELRR